MGLYPFPLPPLLFFFFFPSICSPDQISTQSSHISTFCHTHLCHSVFYNLLARQIALVAYEQLVHALASVTIDFLQPLLHVRKSILISDVINDDDAMGTTIIGGSNCTETLLAGRIPLFFLFFVFKKNKIDRVENKRLELARLLIIFRYKK